ncbi:hypothetical protein KR093_011551 [Drosophila rubida]|uniref:Uncharacterized protein n=1 Tax=Drosophila rubida TaxID=30044 RepID=A0AAD4PJV5_9MUSC|nr:hypothetical protein KR093_011551 [Drosophila rubida]
MAADDALTGVGELLFSLLIGYLGALEFAFVAQHLYHWTCRHPNTQQAVDAAADAEELPRLRDRLDKELSEAAAREAAAGSNVMQDGVAYSNGFRVESPEDKRKALAAELERQRLIEELTRKQLAEAEAKLAEERQRQQLAAEAAENERKLLEAEKQRAAEQREREENERAERERQENERRLLEAERQREENERRIQAEEEAQRQREAEETARLSRAAEEQRELEENERKLRAAEQQRLEEERQRELQEAEAEQQRQLQQAAEAEAARQLLQLDAEDEQARRDAEIVERLLAAERERKLSATESELEEEAIVLEQSRRLAASKTDLERKQKSIEENARLFMEAEEEMVMLHQRMLQAAQEEEQTLYAGATPVVEEPCIRKFVPPRFEEPEPEIEEPLVVQRVKTQLGQGSGSEQPYMVKSKTLMFPGVSDEGSSVEPISSQQSSFSTQPSEERSRQQTEEERQEPEGEDNVPDVQYTEDYLRSLDGIKSRPLVREDGSGRRRAFKKRRSSGSSNSSRDSRASRDEELKMFTSLEEEELRHGEKADYNPIKYTTEPTLRVKSHHRRHKRSPAKDAKPPPPDVTGSLEMLGEESTNPWGEVLPEHYKDTEFWKREKALSIDEEELDLEKRASGEEVLDLPKNKPNASSFEEATDEQNELAANTLRQQRSKDQLDKDNEKESTESSKATEPSSSNSDIKSNLQTSSAAEEQPRRGSPGLRRSPRIDEMDHYEERWRQSEQATHPPSQPQTPSISVQQPDTAPWRDQYGLLMEGLSDFYDFTASVNPSRSRSTSRNPSPQPKNVANRMDVDEQHTLEVYDDTESGPMAGELSCELVLQMLETTINGTEMQVEQLQLQNVADDVQNGCQQMVTMVYEEERLSQPRTVAELEQSLEQKQQLMELEEHSEPQSQPQADVVLPQPVIEINALLDEQMEGSEPVPTREEMRLFVETLRAERNSRCGSASRSRSRSRSPLPTSDNIARSLETRRQKRIRQNDELFEKLQQEELQRSQSTSPLPMEEPQKAATSPSTEAVVPPVSPPAVPTISIDVVEEPELEKEPEDTPESMARLFEQLRLNRCRSHSRSRSRSPLPSAANLEHSLQMRREKLIAQNDAFFEQLEERAKTPEPERRLIVEHRYEYVESTEVELQIESRDMRSLSPSRSRSVSPGNASGSEEDNSQQFHLMLNLEGSDARTLRQHSQELERLLNLEDAKEKELQRLLDNEELERLLASNAKQHEVDLEALQKFSTASEEMELRLMTPPKSEQSSDYERSYSEAARDLKDELQVSGFKRSTYVGESLDLGSEFEQLREEAARFQRSRSPTPSLDLDVAREQAAAQRELQEAILNSLVTASGQDVEKRLGAKPKTSEYERSFSEEVKDTQRMKEESLSSGFKRSTYVGESVDMGITSQLDDLRHRTAEFQRSRSQSRSPVRDEMDANALKNIEAEAAKRELQDQLLDQLAASSVNFQDFSRYLNADFLESERRASDSALIQLDPYADLEPEEYHHFRRYSLAQEQPVEEYPSDECVYISQIEVRSVTGKRTWLKEDFYTRDLADLELNLEESEQKSAYLSEGSWARAVLAAEAEAAEFDETSAIYNYDIVGEASSNDSDDERQTVVEIDDDDDEYEFELDEGISDNNERTQPTDESHHDTSECEEAERNADRYANRVADDWEEVENVADLADYNIDDGAVGGIYSDPDAYIEQIYNDAVKNRKQSGILREYETMIEEQLNAENTDQSESEKDKSSSDSERYALWAKTRELDRSEEQHRHRDIDISIGLLESERRDADMRYLGDAQVAARQSTRLRTRYGYSPKLQVGVVEDDIEVDLNYKPKREYNWRKNFKLDDSESTEAEAKTDYDEEHDVELKLADEQLSDGALEVEAQLPYDGEDSLDMRRFSFGGESITLFSRSPEREKLSDVPEEGQPELENGEHNGQQLEAELPPIEEPLHEKPKKKKSKKKSRKGSKTEEELRDDNDSDTQQYPRRSSATQEDQESNTEAPKRKVRSRRSSKSSANNEELNGGLFSPRNSVGFVAEPLEGIAEYEAPDESASKKKTKKRKKLTKEPKEQSSVEQPEEPDIDQALAAALAEIAPITVSASTNLTPASTQQNLLSSISVGHSLCLTPASSIEEPSTSAELNNNQEIAGSQLTPARSVVDTFDILKDANFYPLF